MSAVDIFCMCTNKKCKDGAENVMKKALGLYMKKKLKNTYLSIKSKNQKRNGDKESYQAKKFSTRWLS